MKKRIILSLGLATAIFTGCGSSSDGDNSGNTKINTGTGYYIDSAISGIDYVCGSKSGKTGSDGSFTFEKGKNCTFSLGSMKLREVKANSLKDQIKVLEDNLAVATLLQTLDSDGNPDNDGIVISAKVIEELKAKNITKLPKNEDEVAEIYEVIKNVEGYKGKLKSEDKAKNHLNKSLGNHIKKLLVNKTFYIVGKEDNEIPKIFEGTFNSTLSKINFKHSNNKTSTENISVIGNKLKFADDGGHSLITEEPNYIKFSDYSEDGTLDGIHRFYLDKSKAKIYFDSL